MYVHRTQSRKTRYRLRTRKQLANAQTCRGRTNYGGVIGGRASVKVVWDILCVSELRVSGHSKTETGHRI